MDGTALTLLFSLLGLLALSATFSGAETALFSLDRLELRRFERSASRRERTIAAICARPDRLLGGILFGNTLVNVASSSIAVALARNLGDLASQDTLVAIAVFADTTLILVFGEILPKGFAVQGPAAASRFYVLLLAPLLAVFRPVAGSLARLAGFLLRAFGVSADGVRSGYSRPELQLLFETSQAEKGISEVEGLIAANLFEFFETRAVEIMTPRVDIEGIPADTPPERLRERLIESRHARLPVYRESLDQVLGFVNTKQFLLHPESSLEGSIVPIHFVPERARVQGILAEMQARRLPMVIVVNEYGGTSGLITREDLVEEIVGEIFDELERDQEPEMNRLGETLWRVDGLVNVDDLAEALGIDLPEGPVQTVAGRIAHRLGRPPKAGEITQDGPVVFRVLQVRRHRARRVEVRVLGGEPGTGDRP